MTVENEVLSKVKPVGKEQEKIEKAVAILLESVTKIIERRGLDAEPILVGSVAKGTHLKDPDIDLFIRFRPEVPLKTIEKETVAIGEAVVDSPERWYAQHPYVKGRFRGFVAEIVPCYWVAEAGAKMSAVDRTPFHTEFIKENLDPGLQDDVRLFKAFLRGIGIYGAEIAVEGFSGYLCEILVMRYGGFKPLLEAASGWKRQVRLRLDEGKFPKFDSPLVFMDPVDSARNVASPVSHHAFSILIEASKAYLRGPTLKFFFPEPIDVLARDDIMNTFRERETDVVGVQIQIPEVVEDIYASQVSKAERTIARLIDGEGFQVVKSDSYIVDVPGRGKKGRTLIVIETGVKELSAVRSHKGPEVGHPNEGNFLDKWKDHPRKAGKPHIRDKRWFVHVKREFRRSHELLMARMEGLSLGKHLSREVKEGFRVLDMESLASEFPEQMSEFLDDRFPWER